MTAALFQFEWLDVAPSPDTLSRSTMAQLSIRVGDSSVTSVLDRRARSHRDHVLVPLLQVAEWLVANWWHIWHEVEDIGSHPQRPGFESRHDLAYAGNGFVLPKLTIVPLGDRMQLRWSRWRAVHAPLEFLDEHSAHVDRSELESQFRSLIDAVIERLREHGCAVESLEREWEAINSLGPDEQEFCQAAALLGLDPFGVPDHLAQAIVEVWNRVGRTLRDEAFLSATADSLASIGEWIEDSLHTLESATNGDGWITVAASVTAAAAAGVAAAAAGMAAPTVRDADSRGMRSGISPPHVVPPWERGYELARFVRHSMNLGDGRFEFDSSGRWALYHRETDTPSERVEGLVAEGSPSCLVSHRSETGTRFLLARSLGDYLGRVERGAGMLTSLATARQAQSRSFAAEFLAPSLLLRERLGAEAPRVDADTVDELACEFGVSSYVIRHQIENHKLGTIVETA